MGTVKSGDDVLASATVSVAHQTTTTNQSGEFKFNVAPGIYKIIVTYAGYKRNEITLIVTEKELSTIEIQMIPNDQLEEVTVMGSSTWRQRSNLYTPVPVDILSAEKLIQTNQASLLQMLNYTLPSFNTDVQKWNEPATIRGLDPNHLLILVNNTRYHNSAWINNGIPKYDLGRGSAANDLNSIPTSAIGKIEVLRDGATAFYGADAIAATMNIRLKEFTGKTSIRAGVGQFYANDGLKTWLGIHRSYRLNKNGYINFAGEFRTQDPTTRAGEFTGLVYKTFAGAVTRTDSLRILAEDKALRLANGLREEDLSKYNGINKLHGFGMAINGEYPLNARLKLGWVGISNYKKNVGWGSYRYPREPRQVNTFIYPNGFRPVIAAENWDLTLTTSLKGKVNKNWDWEMNSSIGNNTSSRNVYNSNNASQQYLYTADAPTSFYFGKMVYNLLISNGRLTKRTELKNKNRSSFTINIGAESRLENYKLSAGDEAATKNYDSTRSTQPGSQPLVGAVAQEDEVNESRHVASVYLGIEIEPHDRLLIDLAGRYEYYSDFGSNLSGKLALRYQLSSQFFLRGSLSNGFRAPSLQQRYFSGIQSFRGSALIQRIYNNESPVTRAFHIRSLEPEKAMNFSLGMVSKLSSKISLTLDGYFIQIRNRLILSGVFNAKDPLYAPLLTNQPGVDFLQFYTNAINTRTYGADLVLNGNWKMNKVGLGLTIAANINRHTIFGPVKTTKAVSGISSYTNTLFGIEERTSLKKDQPGEKLIFSVVANKNKFSFLMRNTYFGNTASVTVQTNLNDTIHDFFSSRVITDFSISYSIKSWFSITLGVNNMFDIYPDRIKEAKNSNQAGITLYSLGSSPFGFNGGYYFLNMNFNW